MSDPEEKWNDKSEGTVELAELDMDSEEFKLKRRDDVRILQGRYLMGKRLGRGASAEVAECLDLRSLQRLVVKVFSVRRFCLEENRDLKLQEIRDECLVLKRLDHRNVLKAYDMIQTEDEHNTTIAVVTEYCACSLQELWRSQPVSPVTGKRHVKLSNCHYYFHQLIDGISFLHSKSIGHGDIKPDNLMILNDNTLKLADFGSYTDFGTFAGQEKKGLSGSSDWFQPPESLVSHTTFHEDSEHEDMHQSYHRQQQEENDRSMRMRAMFTADIWSGTVVLFMISCGEHPFLASDRGSVQQLHQAIVDKRMAGSPILRSNRALLMLFDKVFESNPDLRAGLTDIQRDPWFNLTIAPTDTAGIGPRKQSDGSPGDKYRSMSLTPALNQLIRPIEGTVTILGKDLSDFEHRKEIPYLRGNRSPEPARKQPLSLVQQLRHRIRELRRRF